MVEIQKQANQPGSGVVLSKRKNAVSAVLGPEKRGRVCCISIVKPKEFCGDDASSSKAANFISICFQMSREQLQPNPNSEGLDQVLCIITLLIVPNKLKWTGLYCIISLECMRSLAELHALVVIDMLV
ncbi:hypothetical protein MKX03_006262 [Papaver bracteatum]|nr:hypothetical protein MKX03_006262 [Papaver bracteatum]